MQDMKALHKNKRGIAQWTGVVLGFVLLFIVTVAGLSVLTNMQSTFTTNSVEYNATGDAISGLTKVTDFAVLIGIVVAIAIVIGILFGAFGGFVGLGGGRRGGV